MFIFRGLRLLKPWGKSRRRRRSRKLWIFYSRTVSPLLTLSMLFFPPRPQKKIQFHPSALVCPRMERIHLFNPADPSDWDREWTGKFNSGKGQWEQTSFVQCHTGVVGWRATEATGEDFCISGEQLWTLESTSGHWRGFLGHWRASFPGITVTEEN